jgi:hypothetical protein
MQFVALIVVVVYLIVFGVDESETTVKKYPEQTIESLGWERGLFSVCSQSLDIFYTLPFF